MDEFTSRALKWGLVFLRSVSVSLESERNRDESLWWSQLTLQPQRPTHPNNTSQHALLQRQSWNPLNHRQTRARLYITRLTTVISSSIRRIVKVCFLSPRQSRCLLSWRLEGERKKSDITHPSDWLLNRE